ncbi:MAG: hypothetical protein EBS32_10710 [Actinobacteria bacterium]|nr:hypothetical protein [Actinomycetota bacterium]
MRLRILAVGARQPTWVDAAVAEYQKRIKPPWRLELVARAERVTHAGHEQARHRDPRQVLRAQLLRFRRRVQRVRDEDESRHLQRVIGVRRGHRAHAPTHRTATDDEPGRGHPEGLGERAHLVAHTREEHGRTVRCAASRAPVWEVDPQHRDGCERLLDRDE